MKVPPVPCRRHRLSLCWLDPAASHLAGLLVVGSAAVGGVSKAGVRRPGSAPLSPGVRVRLGAARLAVACAAAGAVAGAASRFAWQSQCSHLRAKMPPPPKPPNPYFFLVVGHGVGVHLPVVHNPARAALGLRALLRAATTDLDVLELAKLFSSESAHACMITVCP